MRTQRLQFLLLALAVSCCYSQSRDALCDERASADADRRYREAVATFDDPIKPFETHLSGSIGKSGSGRRDTTRLLHRPDVGATKGCMELVYRPAADSGEDHRGSMWLSLRGPIKSSHVVLDLSKWDSLSLKVRGRAVTVDRPNAGQPGCTLRVEVRDNRRGTDLWRAADCGFGDAHAKSTGYTNHAVFAIDAGPMLIAIDNYRALRSGDRGTVWRNFVANPEIRHALDAIYGPRAATAFR